MASQQNIWLIRTKQNKILGPITKKKVKDLLSKGSLTPDDEICSGNGYWFWVKEKDLVDKYVHGDIPQDFNPVSEAMTVVANANSGLELEVKEDQTAGKGQIAQTMIFTNPLLAAKSSEANIEDEVLVPAEEDLEYPDIANAAPSKPSSLSLVDNQSHGSSSLPEVKVVSLENEEILIPDKADLEYPELPSPKIVAKTEVLDDEIDNLLSEELKSSEPIIPEPKASDEVEPLPPTVREMPKPSTEPKKKKRRKKVNQEKVKVMPKRNDRVFMYLIVLVVTLVLYGIYYYYTAILGKDLISRALNVVIPDAHAQSLDLDQKKNFN